MNKQSTILLHGGVGRTNLSIYVVYGRGFVLLPNLFK